MNIVIEGPDNSGKSTLARILDKHVPLLSIHPGDGPPRDLEEIIRRAFRYLKLENKIFDRHPIVSEPIYGQFREPPSHIPQVYVDIFYRTPILFIYCHGQAGVHQIKDYDTPEHVKLINDHDEAIKSAYEDWASHHANVRYRVGDDTQPLIQLCKEFIHET